MPIKIPDGLPAEKTLEEENIFTINAIRADMQDIRPLRVLLVNLMPRKYKRKHSLRVCWVTQRFRLSLNS